MEERSGWQGHRVRAATMTSMMEEDVRLRGLKLFEIFLYCELLNTPSVHMLNIVKLDHPIITYKSISILALFTWTRTVTCALSFFFFG